MNDYISSEFLPEAQAFEAALTAYEVFQKDIAHMIEMGYDAGLAESHIRLDILTNDVNMGRAALKQVLRLAGYNEADIKAQVGAFERDVIRKAR